MPHYDYECGACGHSFETFQGVSEDKLRVCPDCGESTLRRLIGRGSSIEVVGTSKGNHVERTPYDKYKRTRRA